MGIFKLDSLITMKFALVVCFAAFVACEPVKPPLIVSRPVTKPQVLAPERRVIIFSPTVPTVQQVPFHGKRSADAGPEAKAETSGNRWVLPRAINIYGQHPTVQQGPYHGKRTFVRPRSADAEPEAEAYYSYYGYGA